MSNFIEFLPLILVFIFLGVFLFLLPLRFKKMNAALVSYFGATENFLLGDILFQYGSMNCRISRVSRGGGGYSNYGGFFLSFSSEVKSSDSFFIGHRESGKYSRGPFLILPPNEKVQVGSEEILVASKAKNLIEKVKKASENPKFQTCCSVLFSKEFNHLTIASEIQFQTLLPKKKYVLKYSPVPGEVFEKPADLKIYLDSIMQLCSILDFQFE